MRIWKKIAPVPMDAPGAHDPATVELLLRITNGDADAGQALYTRLHAQLRDAASARLRHEASGHLLDTTELLDEAFMKTADRAESIQNREHFCRLASRIMRNILVDRARTLASRRRAEATHEELRVEIEEEGSLDALALDAALDKLAALDEVGAWQVELRWFGGLTIAQAADVLGVDRGAAKQRYTLLLETLRGYVNGLVR